MDRRHGRALFITVLVSCTVLGSTIVAAHHAGTPVEPMVMTGHAWPSSFTNPVDDTVLFPVDPRWTNPPVECLIITNAALAPEFEPLAAVKIARGVYTEIITTEAVYANSTFTSSGPDQAAWIRNAIKYFHDTRGTEFVILGGDVNIIPTRYVYNPEGTEQHFGTYLGMDMNVYKPTDHYYAKLNGTWDEDGDGRFGEMNTKNANNVDEVDWEANVYVGRLPVNNVAQARTVVEKIINYDVSPPDGDWFERSIFAGAVSQFAESQMLKPAVDEAELSEFIIDTYFTTTDIVRLYQTSASYVPPSPYTALTKQNLVNAWNQGASLLNMAGHGDPASFGGYQAPGSFTWYMTRGDVPTLNNANKLPLVYIFSCSSGAFDVREAGIGSAGDSLAEALILKENAGAIAVIAAARTSYYFETDKTFEALNRGQNRFFWREFLLNREYQPGKTFYLSLESYITQFIDKYWNVNLNWNEELAQRDNYLQIHEYFRKNILTYNLLGDPEMRIRTAAPVSFAPSSFPQAIHSGDTLLLDVRNMDGHPVANTRVLVNGSGYYITADTDFLGRACLTIPRDPALVNETMSVTLSGHNMVQARVDLVVRQDDIPPARFEVSLPEQTIDARGGFSFTASGVDEGSGLRQAHVVFLAHDGSVAGHEPMRLVVVNGNETRFSYQATGDLQPGTTMSFYVIAFDAAGHHVIATGEGGQAFTITVNGRILETVLLVVVGIGIPAAAVGIVSWLVVSRKRAALAAERPW